MNIKPWIPISETKDAPVTDNLIKRLRDLIPNLEIDGYLDSAEAMEEAANILEELGKEAVAVVTVGDMGHGPFIFAETPYGVDHLPDGESRLFLTPQIAPECSALSDVIAELQRRTPEHDDTHPVGDLARAGASYAFSAALAVRLNVDDTSELPVPFGWPWVPPGWFKPTNIRRDLVSAVVLILAEIERLDRAEAKAKP